jgi:prepilin-type N-terminal cleavage/methylation domain-containing protein
MQNNEDRRSKMEDRKNGSSRSSILHPRSANPAAFTLVELLVVILIIGILIGILIPVVTKIKIAGQKADSLAQLNAIRGAIEAYHGTYNAYPGPVPDIQMFQVPTGTNMAPFPSNIPGNLPNAHMTASENLVLGLMGGLSVNAGVVQYNYADVGSGPRSLNQNSPGQHQPFYTSSKDLSKGFFTDSGGRTPCYDSDIPEFQDRFPDPLPVLYLRAKKGAPGVVSDGQYFNAMTAAQLYQYDVRQYYWYIADCSSEPPSTGLTLGGKKQSAVDPKNGGEMGLWKLAAKDPHAQTIPPPSESPFHEKLPNYAILYLNNFAISPPGTQHNLATPRSKDSFILISPGPDRIYGTNDDVTTFGTPGPE